MKKRFIFSALLRMVFLKRYSILLVAMSVFAINGLSAVELWNGFTTDMTRDQVVAHANTAFSSSNFERTTRRFVPFHREGDRRQLNSQYPSQEEALEFRSPSAQYVVVYFYFSNGRLFGIEVVFGSVKEADFLPLAQQQYGRYTETFIETYRGIPNNSFAPPFQKTWYVWKLTGRIVYTIGQTIREGSRGYAMLFICDRQAIDNFVKERADAEARRKEEAASKIQF